MRKFTVFVLVLGISVAIPTVPALATFPGGVGMVAFTQPASDGHLVIAIASEDLLTNSFGPPQVLVDLGPGIDAQGPAWAPDGTHLAFTAPLTAGGPSQIWVADGRSSPYPVTSGARPASDPAWSPDGGSIAFDRSGMAGRPHVVVRNLTLHTSVPVARDLIESSQPAWSSTGTLWVSGKLLIGKTNICGDSCRWQLYSVDPTGGSSPTRVTTSGFGVREPDWSPDGSQVVATVVSHRQAAGLIVISSTGNQDAFYPSGSSATYSDASWSPVIAHGGALLAITYTWGGSSYVGIFDPVRGPLFITSGPAWGPAWEPVPPL
jgi:dipeptidyl aminopeptidase/acylaminoacyl peptidase